MARQIEQVVQSKLFPYRTKGDLLRHALHRHMNWLNSQEPVVGITTQVDAILELLRDEEMNTDFSLVFSRLDSRVAQYMSEGSRDEAARLVIIIQNHIEGMPDGFWKKKYKARLERSYKNLMDKAPRANLGRMED